jgi:hypothetical protein
MLRLPPHRPRFMMSEPERRGCVHPSSLTSICRAIDDGTRLDQATSERTGRVGEKKASW